MNPPQSARDEDVMGDIQKWMDELRDLVSLGEDELGDGYKITAIKAIATQKIRDELDREERECEMKGLGMKEKWERMSRYAINMSRDHFLVQRDTPPKRSKTDPNAMDVGMMDQGGWHALQLVLTQGGQVPAQQIGTTPRGGGPDAFGGAAGAEGAARPPNASARHWFDFRALLERACRSDEL